MGILFLAVAFCIVNIALWVVFLSRFKKLFTTDNILENYRKELRNMTEDIDRHANRTISLIENTEKELRALIAEADRHVALARSELEKQQQSQIFQQRLAASRPVSAKGRQSPQQRAAGMYLKESADSSYTLTAAGQRQVSVQGTLFEDVSPEEEAAAPQKRPLAPNTFTVARDGSSYASVPVFAPNVSFSDNPIRPKKDFASQVRELSQQGASVEEIAHALERTTTEVQFVLDMGM